jgi:hypothetical protein
VAAFFANATRQEQTPFGNFVMGGEKNSVISLQTSCGTLTKTKVQHKVFVYYNIMCTSV